MKLIQKFERKQYKQADSISVLNTDPTQKINLKIKLKVKLLRMFISLSNQSKRLNYFEKLQIIS